MGRRLKISLTLEGLQLDFTEFTSVTGEPKAECIVCSKNTVLQNNRSYAVCSDCCYVNKVKLSIDSLHSSLVEEKELLFYEWLQPTKRM